LGGKPIEDLRALRARFRENQPEDTVQLEVRHGKDIRKLEIKLATVPEAIPADNIPPAHAVAKPAEGKEPERGSIQLKSPAIRDPVVAYVPEAYSPNVAYGIVVWLHGSEGLKEAELIAAWKPFCDQHDLILVAPKSATSTRWRPAEVRMVPMLLAQLAAAYTIDSSRVVVCGRETGGTLAYSAAFSYANLVRGVAAVDAPMSGTMTERDSPLGLAFYVARAEKSRFGVAIKQTVNRLREMKFPVTIKELGPEPRDLHPNELGELARWIDALDRM
jgi:serine protease Do